MSKAKTGPTPPGTAGDAPKLMVPARVDVDEAMKRFAPFIFSIDTETKETTDLKNLTTSIARDPGMAGNLFPVDRTEAVQWVAGLNDPNIAQLITDAKAQLAAVIDGGGDPQIVAQCVRCRIVSFAGEREDARIEEEEQIAARHAELVERLMEDGLTRTEAEKAAKEEEDAAELAAGADAGDDEEGGVTRPQAFVLLKGSVPNTPEQVVMLHKLGVPVNVVLNVNSLAKFGRKDDGPAVDPKAKGKKPEVKKPDTKKGKGKEEVVAAPLESFVMQMQKERAKLGRFESHPIKEVALWTYDVAVAEGKTVDEATGLKMYDLQESEAEVADKVAQRVIQLEQAVHDYRSWIAKKCTKTVGKVHIGGPHTSGEVPPTPAEQKKPDPVPAKPPPPPPKKGKTPAKEEPTFAEAPPPPPPPPPLPGTMDAIPVEDELYRRIIDEIAPANASFEVLMHCLLEQVQETVINVDADTTGAASAISESIAAKNRKDVSDFCDFVLAALDGQQDMIFEAARKKRLKAAEAPGQSADNDNVASKDAETKGPLAASDTLRLLPATCSTIDGDSLLFGVPLRKIEGRIRRALFTHVDDEAKIVRTDVKPLTSIEEGKQLLKMMLEQRLRESETNATRILELRTHGHFMPWDLFCERLASVLRQPSTARVTKFLCEDGKSGALIVHQSVPSERKRFRRHWRIFHGNVSFPQWLEWTEFWTKENLHFNPPPKDSDDEDEVDETGAEGADEDDEDEEEIIGYDDDGEPIMGKKEKKIPILPPDYINYDKLQMDEIRRRAVMDLTKERLNDRDEEFLLADNHTSTVVAEDEIILFPDDGAATITTSLSSINTKSVHCTVNSTLGADMLFGFRARVAAIPPVLPDPAEQSMDAVHAAPPPPPPQPVGKGQPPPSTPRGGVKGAPLAVAEQSTEEEKKEEEAPKEPPMVKSGVFATLTIGDEAHFHVEVSCPQPTKGKTTDDTEGDREESTAAEEASEAAAEEELVPQPTVYCACGGLGIAISNSGSFTFTHETPRDCPVTLFNPTTNTISRTFLTETHRTILVDGSVLVSFEDGTKLNMFPNGNTAVLHQKCWLITNASGRRVLKLPDGTVKPLVLSLVTTNTDVETMSKVTTREDGVVTVQYDDGRKLVQHIEGTRMWQDASRSIVEIETDGLPLVCGTPKAGQNSPPPAHGAISSSDERSPDRESNGAIQNEPMLKFRSLTGMSAVLLPERMLSISHEATGLQAVVDFRTLLLHVKPQQAFATRYAIDFAFGGLRGVDDHKSYHVTPFGRCKIRPLLDDQPVLPTQEPGVKQIIEVFMEPEVVDSTFNEAMKKLGIDASVFGGALHTFADVPEPPMWDLNASGLAMPPRSRQLREKERGCISTLQDVVPKTKEGVSFAAATGNANGVQLEAPPHMLSPYLFLFSREGCCELIRRCDARQFVNTTVAGSNLLFTDVMIEADGQKPPPAGMMLAAGLHEKNPPPPPLSHPGALHMVVSAAPAKTQIRAGIPKILLDLRRSSTHSGPMSVAHFLQELKQGPSQAIRDAGAGSGVGDVVSVAARHFVRFGETHSDAHKLIAHAAGKELWERALVHLARAIPPIIAAQLNGPKAMAKRDLNRSRHRVSGHDSRGSGGSSQRKRTPAGTGYGAAQRAEDDKEFADQLEQAEVAEAAKRKAWPTPIPDRKQKLEDVKGTATGNYWHTIGKPHVPELADENRSKYTAAAGYRKVTVPHYATPPPIRPTEPIDRSPPKQATAPIPAPPRQPYPAAQLRDSIRGDKFVTYSDAQPPNLPQQKKTSRIVCTPQIVDFGSITSGFRYTTTLQITNIGTGACRYRATLPPAGAPGSASWITLQAPKQVLAPGMSIFVTITIDGTQPVDVSGNPTQHTIMATVSCETNTVQVAIHSTTTSAGRPASRQRQGVRLLGPSKLQYVPGSVKMPPKQLLLNVTGDEKETPPIDDDSDEE